MTYPTTIKAIIDGSELYQGEPLYMSDIDTHERALDGAATALADYLEKHFANDIYCGHGRDSMSLAEKLVEEVDGELDNEGRFEGLAAVTTDWRHVASQIVVRTAITLSLLHAGKMDVFQLDYCDECASANDADNGWSARSVAL
jgi:hypothetical protein